MFSPRDVYLEDYGALVYYVAVLSSGCFLPAYLMTSVSQIKNSCYRSIRPHVSYCSIMMLLFMYTSNSPFVDATATCYNMQSIILIYVVLHYRCCRMSF